MQLAALLQHVTALEVRGPVDRAVDAVTRDSRSVTPPSVFVAIRGGSVDGHDVASEVEAAAVVVERSGVVRPGVTEIVVPSTRLALATFAAALWDHPGAKLRVVGVTGTIPMDADRNPVKPAVILKVEGGRFRFAAAIAPAE